MDKNTYKAAFDPVESNRPIDLTKKVGCGHVFSRTAAIALVCAVLMMTGILAFANEDDSFFAGLLEEAAHTIRVWYYGEEIEVEVHPLPDPVPGHDDGDAYAIVDSQTGSNRVIVIEWDEEALAELGRSPELSEDEWQQLLNAARVSLDENGAPIFYYRDTVRDLSDCIHDGVLKYAYWGNTGLVYVQMIPREDGMGWDNPMPVNFVPDESEIDEYTIVN